SEGELGKGAHALLGALQESLALAAAQQMEAEADDRIGNPGGARDGMNAELHAAVIQPLPHLPVHLSHLHVSVERSVIPSPDARGPTAELLRALEHLADPDPYEDIRDAKSLELEQHVTLLEWDGGVVVGPHNRGVGELIAAHQSAGDLPAPLLDRHSRRFSRQRLAQLGDRPATARRGARERGEVEVERLSRKLGQTALNPGRAGQRRATHDRAAGISILLVSSSIPPVMRPPASFTTRSRNE